MEEPPNLPQRFRRFELIKSFCEPRRIGVTDDETIETALRHSRTLRGGIPHERVPSEVYSEREKELEVQT